VQLKGRSALSPNEEEACLQIIRHIFDFSDYANRAYMLCETNLDKDLMGIMLKGKITAAIQSNELHTKDWANEPIPT